jgi:predicted NACHT family NTPase
MSGNTDGNAETAQFPPDKKPASGTPQDGNIAYTGGDAQPANSADHADQSTTDRNAASQNTIGQNTAVQNTVTGQYRFEALNEEQQRAVAFDGKHLLVLAGAGTGKTRTIIARAAYLIAHGTNPAKIQIVTFTKRAAAEIVARVKAELPQSSAKSLNGSTFHSWCNQMLTKYRINKVTGVLPIDNDSTENQ